MLVKLAIPAFAMIVMGAGSANAQLGGRRCEGWTGAPGVSGLIIVDPGSTCVGSIFGKPNSRQALISTRVAQPPAKGSFQMTGLRTFSYSAPPTNGSDRVVVESEWQIDGRTAHRRRTLKIMTKETYIAQGGNQMGPGAGTVTSHSGAVRRKMGR